MDESKEKLKVVLNRKKTELKRITDKVARAEAAKSLQTASALVRSSNNPQDPIWVEGLPYPAQYLVRTTRSMSATSRAVLPPLRVPKTEVDFHLPAVMLDNRPPSVSVQWCAKDEDRPLTLCSVCCVCVRLDEVLKVLYTLHDKDTHVAIIRTNDLFLLTQKQGLKWRECLPQTVTCADICSDGLWLLIVTGGCGLRAYLDGPHGHKHVVNMADLERPCGDVCVWSKCAFTFEVALTSGNQIFLWQLKSEADNRWSVRRVTNVGISAPCKSLVHVQDTEQSVLGTCGSSLFLWDGVTMKEFSLACGPLDSTVSVVWAWREEGHTFVVLRTLGVCVLAVVGDGVKLLTSVHAENLRSVRYGGGLLHMLSEDVLSVWKVDADEPSYQLKVTGCSLVDCLWTSKEHLLVLSSSLHLYYFK